ncbi:archaeal heat shock protein Hsp14 [Acidianus sp. HS-5]|uniref:archaeal heat shock protein Hsp14 n=1 Tax=Acidianus sp. HS-5 TaxID=2886040 RepID=UPI001F1B1389|nr:archaeal heat shock protein Hsp14 [Acidianus sp. HS-5]BDC17955.1 heat-shock protein Hsp20 [Acidianus sp. HS-5]
MSLTTYVRKEISKRLEDLTRSFYENVLPPVDIYEEGGYLNIDADLPGFQKDKIHLRLTSSNEIVIEAEREIPESGVKYLTQRPKRLSRTIKLPVTVKKDSQVTAKYDNGVLHISIPVEGTTSIKIE